ncbi:hypothetical protein BDU57DRAFT_87486 [Ampelomyces quisqualis]|uniref:Uncharacterized protein n=1 Tax=Ampelomyces quisqualis TaxID=50730 RepID=A0A6A5QAM9_AMPQU|nr:hypothetical protein BDU57DRAFT_87486 [Ampelomyces quisqualis]
MHASGQPAAEVAHRRVGLPSSRMHAACDSTSHRGAAPQSTLDTLPVEVVNHILSYLTHPRSRLPGLTEAQSARDYCPSARSVVKSREDLTSPPDSGRWAADLFQNHLNIHPFHALSLTSRRCHALVESCSAHLVRACNMFNLPFAQFDQFGPGSVWPDLSGIVYRRLWLQHAPRRCIYCFAVMDVYPFPVLKRLLTGCESCFYRQTLQLDEIERQYHISPGTILASPSVRGNRNSVWFLRIDVEALALQLYGTRAFHDAHPEQFGKPCSICAITKFTPTHRVSKHKSSQKTERRLASQKKKLRRSSRQ